MYLHAEGIDYSKLNQLVPIQQSSAPQAIQTIFRPGIQPTRTFTVHLVPDSSFISIHPHTHVNGTITINIMDDSSKSASRTGMIGERAERVRHSQG